MKKVVLRLIHEYVSTLVVVVAIGLAAFGGGCGEDVAEDELDKAIVGKGDHGGGSGGAIEPLNMAAQDLIIYELQARSANACIPETCGQVCKDIVGPQFDYFGTGCDELDSLRNIKKSTLDDIMATHDIPHRSEGITLQYVDEVVGANAVWLMPVFVHNYQYDLPHHCDDLGSPYAVRDYYHVRGTLSERCILEGRDEWSETPCWANPELEDLIKDAHGRGMKVMLDLAFNHLGHEYLFYDVLGVKATREWLEDGANFWDFDNTYEEALLWPEILDTPEELPSDAQGVLAELCDETPGSQERVRRYLMWREGFDYEREDMDCQRPDTLENQVPGFYLSNDNYNPSRQVGDNFTNNWADVKFLFNNELNAAHQWEFVRTREFAFRVVNYYLSLGVDAFRMDHANGLTENEWRYVFHKAEYYQKKRGLPEPIFLSESFHNIQDLNRVFDVLTEGYHHDISHGKRDANYIEKKLFEGRSRYIADRSFVFLHLENHDEGRLLKPTTGFDIWRGATFYAIAALSRGTLGILGGQEWGEPWDLGFRRSDYLRGRFPKEGNWNPMGDELTNLYRAIHKARLAPENVAIRKGAYYFPRTDKGTAKDQLFAVVKYMEDCSNTIFGFHRLWVDDVEATYSMTPDLAGKICLSHWANYRLVDVFTGVNVWRSQYDNGTRTGKHLQEFGIYVHLPLSESFQWLRLEQAD